MFRRMAPSGNSLYGKISPDSNELNYEQCGGKVTADMIINQKLNYHETNHYDYSCGRPPGGRLTRSEVRAKG